MFFISNFDNQLSKDNHQYKINYRRNSTIKLNFLFRQIKDINPTKKIPLNIEKHNLTRQGPSRFTS